ncbi:hypothetical protein RUM44_004370 [Polyplax serrata]|uniref:Uncharacterized protein n=1 Tax=Polyplax serrata TaxID=468196 RepID=A0ABR1B308_POLSC
MGKAVKFFEGRVTPLVTPLPGIVSTLENVGSDKRGEKARPGQALVKNSYTIKSERNSFLRVVERSGEAAEEGGTLGNFRKAQVKTFLPQVRSHAFRDVNSSP